MPPHAQMSLTQQLLMRALVLSERGQRANVHSVDDLLAVLGEVAAAAATIAASSLMATAAAAAASM